MENVQGPHYIYTRSAIHIAAAENDVETLEKLLSNEELDINAVDSLGRTALHCLLSEESFDNLECLKKAAVILKEAGADINVQDHHMNTPIHLVFETYLQDIPDVIKMVLEIFPWFDNDLQNEEGFTFFHMLMSDVNDVAAGRDDVMGIIKKKDQFIKDILNGSVTTICETQLERLLNKKSTSGCSAFQTYIDGDCYDIETIKLMIQRGADINSTSNLGLTALMDASLRNRTEIIDILLQAGADPNVKDIFEQTAMFRVNSNKALELIIAYGGDIHAKDRFGRSPAANSAFFLQENFPKGKIALQREKSEKLSLADILFENGLDPNYQDIFGSTLLHYAAWWSNEEIIHLLMKWKANKKIKDVRGMTPYDLAMYNGNLSVAPILLCDDDNDKQAEIAETKMDMVKKYARITINKGNINDMDSVLRMLGINDDPQLLIETAMKSPVFGMTNRKIESADVTQSVRELMQRVALVISKENELFKVTVKPTGSSSEGTMIGDPGEFDFILCLDRFADECTVYQPDDLLETGFVYLKLKDKPENQPFHYFLSKNGYICARRVRETFQDVVVKALNDREVWTDKNLYFDGLVELPGDKPILNAQVHWYGSVYKNITISIDIVPGIFKHNWFPREIDQNKLKLLNDVVKKTGFFLLFHGPLESSDRSDDLIRISSAAMEIAFFRNAPEICREIYAVSKIMKSRDFCPIIQFDCNLPDQEYEKKSSILKSEKTNEVVFFQFSKKEFLEMQGKSPGVKLLKDTDNVQNISDWLVAMDSQTRAVTHIFTPKSDVDTVRKATPVAAPEKEEFESETSRQSMIVYSRSGNVPSEIENLKPNVECEDKGVGKGSIRAEYKITDRTDTGFKQESIKKKSRNVSDNIETEVMENIMIGEEDESDETENDEDDDEEEWEDMEDDIEEEMCDREIEWEGGEIVEASKCITSYMLKNCLLHVLSEKSLKSKYFAEELDHLGVVIKMFEYLQRSAQQRTLNAYCLPFVNIFSYVKEHIQKLSREDIDKEVTELCYRIEHFCQLILGILKQKEKKS